MDLGLGNLIYEKQEVSIVDNQILAHTKYNCTCHIVFITKCRKKVMYGKIGKEEVKLNLPYVKLQGYI